MTVFKIKIYIEFVGSKCVVKSSCIVGGYPFQGGATMLQTVDPNIATEEFTLHDTLYYIYILKLIFIYFL